MTAQDYNDKLAMFTAAALTGICSRGTIDDESYAQQAINAGLATMREYEKALREVRKETTYGNDEATLVPTKVM